jgi:hypothetical protein
LSITTEGGAMPPGCAEAEKELLRAAVSKRIARMDL